MCSIHRRILLYCVIACLVNASADGSAIAASFRGVGSLPGGTPSSHAFGISADGLVVVGDSGAVATPRAFRWTAGGGMVDLGDLPGGPAGGVARDASANGAVIVGYAGTSVAVLEAMRWTAEGGMVSLGMGPSSHAQAISADGSVIVGAGSPAGSLSRAFYWTAANGAVNLPSSGGIVPQIAYGVSADGTFAAGFARHEASGFDVPFLWSAEGGLIRLGGEGVFGRAADISPNGRVVVGVKTSGFGSGEAFRWTAEEGMVLLNPGAGFFSSAQGVSADGSVIVGSRSIGEAFIWDAQSGMRDLASVLTGMGVDLGGWKLVDAVAVSDDGTTIVGLGTNPAGRGEGWIATIPEPAALPLLGFAVLLLRRRGNGRIYLVD